MADFEEQKRLIENKIEEEKEKIKKRIFKIIEREKDPNIIAQYISEEKEKTEQKVEQLKAQKRALEARARTQQRKDRTRRLIQHGALAEKYLDCEGADKETFEKVLKDMVRTLNAGQQKKLEADDKEPLGYQYYNNNKYERDRDD